MDIAYSEQLNHELNYNVSRNAADKFAQSQIRQFLLQVGFLFAQTTVKDTDIENLVLTEPSKANIAVAKEWLAKKKQCTRSVQAVAQVLLQAVKGPEELAWFSSWLKDKDSCVQQRTF